MKKILVYGAGAAFFAWSRSRSRPKKVAAPQHCVQANVMLKSEGLYIFQTLKSKLYYRRYMDRNASFLFRWNKASP